MVSDKQILLAVAADRREFSGFTGLEPARIGLRWSAWGRLGDRRALLVAHGAGCDNAAEAVRVALGRFQAAAIVSTGWAGGLDPGLSVGDVFTADTVARLHPPVEYPVNLPDVYAESARRGRLVTVDRVISSAGEKAELYATGAAAVDMEAAAVAAEAERRGLPFFCVRAISDEAGTSFEMDFNRCRRADGTFSGWKVITQAGASPRRWRELRRLARDSARASERLASFLAAARFPLEND